MYIYMSLSVWAAWLSGRLARRYCWNIKLFRRKCKKKHCGYTWLFWHNIGLFLSVGGLVRRYYEIIGLFLHKYEALFLRIREVLAWKYRALLADFQLRERANKYPGLNIKNTWEHTNYCNTGMDSWRLIFMEKKENENFEGSFVRIQRLLVCENIVLSSEIYMFLFYIPEK